MSVAVKTKPAASANWMKLQKTLSKASKNEPTRKKRKLEHRHVSPPSTISKAASSSPSTSKVKLDSVNVHDDSLEGLRDMVHGRLVYAEAQQAPGKYIALDCEMVGVGLEGEESSLARVSIVNYFGAVLLDEIVRQRERVVDYRTQWSGIRPEDMARAKPFDDVQKQVAELLKDRILVGHALSNDFKALLITHPRPHVRDTQHYAHKFKLSKSNRIALRDLVKQELQMTIQAGEHSSVTDARVTMAVFRLHRKKWEQGAKPLVKAGIEVDELAVPSSSKSSKKRKKQVQSDEESSNDEVTSGSARDRKQKHTPSQTFPGGGRKGVSSGLSTIVRRHGGSKGGGVGGGEVEGAHKEKKKWWASLPGQDTSSSKGSVSLKRIRS